MIKLFYTRFIVYFKTLITTKNIHKLILIFQTIEINILFILDVKKYLKFVPKHKS